MRAKVAKDLNRRARAAGLNDSQRRRAKKTWSRAPRSVQDLRACVDAAKRWNPGGGQR